MGIFLERFILGGSFLLLIVFGIILLLLKDNVAKLKNLHRYLGVSILLSAFALIYMYLELVEAGDVMLHSLRVVIALAYIIAYFYIGYKVVRSFISKINLSMPRGNVADETSEEEDDTDAVDEVGNPIPQPSADNMDDMIFFQKLEAVMAQKRLFNDPDITREQVAMEVGTNRTYLIRSIKLATGKTFNEYLTALRINYAATLLVTTDEPLDYIGTLAGFRSKSVYYRAFSAANNCTPSEYRNRNK